MATAEETPDHSTPVAQDLSCGCRAVMGRKGWTLHPCSNHSDKGGNYSLATPTTIEGQRPHLVIYDELAEVAAPADDRWTHVRGVIETIKKGPFKDSREIRLSVLGRRENGETVTLESRYVLAEPRRLYDERGAIDRVLRGMIHDMEAAPGVQIFSERNPR